MRRTRIPTGRVRAIIDRQIWGVNEEIGWSEGSCQKVDLSHVLIDLKEGYYSSILGIADCAIKLALGTLAKKQDPAFTLTHSAPPPCSRPQHHVVEWLPAWLCPHAQAILEAHDRRCARGSGM